MLRQAHTHVQSLQSLRCLHKNSMNVDVRPNLRHPALLDTSAWGFQGGFCVNVISTKISCASHNVGLDANLYFCDVFYLFEPEVAYVG